MRLLTALVILTLLAVACGSADSGTITAEEPVADSAVPATTPFESQLPPPIDGAPLDAAMGDLSLGFNQAGFELLAQQPDDENMVLSPVSIGHALLMARGAADEPTGAAIDAAFGLSDGLEPHDAWLMISDAIDASNGTREAVDGTPTPVVRIADRIWPATDLVPTAEWVDLLRSRHNSDISPIDVGDPEGSRNIINQWVSDNTEALIPELLPAGFIDGSTRLVLTDAIYFKAQWAQLFGKYGTVDMPFTFLDGTTEPITLMRELELSGTPRGVGDGFTAAVIPYLGDDYSMTVIVPDEGRFDDVRASLSGEMLDTIDSFAVGPFELLLAKWETEASIDLLPWLSAIGAAPGNYPGISDGVFLGGAVHAANIAVDEIGTVAAAATGLGFAESGPPEPELTVATDKPFLYVIRHTGSGMVLFAGQVTDPR